jgi:hypothetical protein
MGIWHAVRVSYCLPFFQYKVIEVFTSFGTILKVAMLKKNGGIHSQVFAINLWDLLLWIILLILIYRM